MTGFDLARPPHGLAMMVVPEASMECRTAARRFCLDTIREVYGTEYRADWHADLDSLTGPLEHCWFASGNRGAFWSLHAPDAAILATAGFYRLAWKPGLVAAFADRYPSPDDVVQLVRVYVRKDQRGRGIGQWLSALVEAQARRQGFQTLYLHANSATNATITFWRSRRFDAFASADGTTHFDKVLNPQSGVALF